MPLQDPSPVQERGPPKSVTVEDSFKTCRGLAAVEKVPAGVAQGGMSFPAVVCCYAGCAMPDAGAALCCVEKRWCVGCRW